jgi:hypothetical protein
MGDQMQTKVQNNNEVFDLTKYFIRLSEESKSVAGYIDSVSKELIIERNGESVLIPFSELTELKRIILDAEKQLKD